MDELAHLVYACSRNFPREELFGLTSQLRRAALSIILNYIEGYARIKDKVHKNFLEISYGSLKETQYLLEFSNREKYISEADYKNTSKLADDIGAMLWGILRKF
ncbi:MAG: hypothetical protein A2660_01505 [Candidatus Doudnabacteria bacterium RIFCSPHIGHO2_01_FULL_45_18]|uniref:Four helix bundle protein n=1 Tax=Candidatus Doudnabacteria bacterium RIFCSPHIGHO2_01_FULL_45_18 TaxID=1817823 RepID=A0A1F5NSJ2_9BACT|nr:MAG: hypothetical protein A2660_01505 [Candidatus Doudnabacteria bacterium RIFCSPHIGHO2_01_FULL_45_18]